MTVMSKAQSTGQLRVRMRRRRRMRERMQRGMRVRLRLQAGAPAAGTSAVRPQFFSGMLLTEDDLQSITDYVVEKRRLTNRSVFGNGVVCGLDVSCDPCDVGSVVVGPGYALDCCGNDIGVSCPETLDVLALVPRAA